MAFRTSLGRRRRSRSSDVSATRAEAVGAFLESAHGGHHLAIGVLTDAHCTETAGSLVHDDSSSSVTFLRQADDGVSASGSEQLWRDPDELVGVLRARPPFDVIVDARAREDQAALMELIVWALPVGGLYAMIVPEREWSGPLARRRRRARVESAAVERRRAELKESVEELAAPDGLVAVRKRRSHYFVLRHRDATATMGERFGPGWGEVISRRPAYQFESRAELVMHGEPAPREKPRTIDVPELELRRYHDATCRVREISTRENLILPDTYRHWTGKTLFHKRIVGVTPHFGRPVDEVEQAPVQSVAGEFFTFDSAFPTHFGHMTTETLSRYWGWQQAIAHHRGLRVVMTHQSGKKALPSWKAQILRALGIATDDIVWVTESRSVRVESLIAAMPQLVNPAYIDQGITQTWAELYAGLGADPAPRDRPEKIFVSRRDHTQRHCANTAEVESFMSDQGFAVLLPERMSFSEQAHTFRAAKVIAGFAGSGLFNMMFNPDARIVALTSDNYVAANEYLFASAAGNEIHYFWAPATIGRPPHGTSVAAYRSDFEFPLEQHRSDLIAALR